VPHSSLRSTATAHDISDQAKDWSNFDPNEASSRSSLDLNDPEITTYDIVYLVCENETFENHNCHFVIFKPRPDSTESQVAGANNISVTDYRLRSCSVSYLGGLGSKAQYDFICPRVIVSYLLSLVTGCTSGDKLIPFNFRYLSPTLMNESMKKAISDCDFSFLGLLDGR
jgi:hypothetical protein